MTIIIMITAHISIIIIITMIRMTIVIIITIISITIKQIMMTICMIIMTVIIRMIVNMNITMLDYENDIYEENYDENNCTNSNCSSNNSDYNVIYWENGEGMDVEGTSDSSNTAIRMTIARKSSIEIQNTNTSLQNDDYNEEIGNSANNHNTNDNISKKDAWNDIFESNHESCRTVIRNKILKFYIKADSTFSHKECKLLENSLRNEVNSKLEKIDDCIYEYSMHYNNISFWYYKLSF